LHRNRHVTADVQAAPVERCAEQFLGEERIALGMLFDLRQRLVRRKRLTRSQHLLQQLPHFIACQSPQRDRRGSSARRNAAQSRQTRIGGGFPRTKRHDEEDRRSVQVPHQMRRQLDRAGVSPLQVFDDTQERPARRFAPERRRDALEEGILRFARALTLRPARGRAQSTVERAEQCSKRKIREVDPFLARPNGGRHVIARTRLQFSDETRLADACLAFNRDEAQPPRARCGQLVEQKGQLFPTADKLLATRSAEDHGPASAAPARNPVLGLSGEPDGQALCPASWRRAFAKSIVDCSRAYPAVCGASCFWRSVAPSRSARAAAVST